jgi:hypothetical protein
MDTLITPLAAWRPPLPAKHPAPLPPPRKPAEPDWCDHAAQEHWAEAVVAYLRSDWRKKFPLWTVINEIVAESCPRSRFDVRAATFEVLGEVMRLRRERVIFRFQRQWIAILPLESASKGRFEKGEPNIHGGEDLDLPTYVRRGIALN